MHAADDKAFEPGEFSQLIQAARAGASEALGQVLEGFRQYLLVLARHSLEPDVHSKVSSSDLVQETFLNAHREFHTFRGSSPEDLKAWLRAILLNQLTDFVRRYRGTSKRRVSSEVCLQDVAAEALLGARTPAVDLSPSDQVADRERSTLLDRALQQLPDHYLQVILLRHRENRSFEEIGPIMNRSADAARKLWLRAIALLKANLGEGHGD